MSGLINNDTFTIKNIDFNDFVDKKNPLVVIDSSVFLDYYRYNSQTSQEILQILESIEEKIWIPYHVYVEFCRNYENVKKPNHNKYTNVSTNVGNFTNDFSGKLIKLFNQYGKYDFPKIHELNQKIKPLIDKINEEAKNYHEKINEEVKANKELMKNNAIFEFINSLKKSGKIEESFSSQKLLEIIEEGERRYRFNLPPGYEDKDKKEEKHEKPDPLRPFGDLIIWKSILKKAKETGASIIFTTSDSKEDWWHLDSNDNILGPRNELLSEFNDTVGESNRLLMLPMREFIKYFSRKNRTSSTYSMIELNAQDIIIDNLNDELPNITHELIHNGELEEFMEFGLVEDVSDLEFYEIYIDDNVDFEEEKASIEGSFFMKTTAVITESIHGEYSNTSKYYLDIEGYYSIELDLEIKEEDYDYCISSSSVNGIKVISATIEDDDFEKQLCNLCKKRDGDIPLYPSRHICSKCAHSGNRFICTNCGTVFETDDYNGDGEHCQLCRNNDVF